MKQSIEEKIEKRAREIIANPGHREPPSPDPIIPDFAYLCKTFIEVSNLLVDQRIA
ncbi:MAG: hypothetical protein ISS19_04520 [Bacteroidales bacterium]|nr:hypothetical protein [Bacteroidales bacterium]